VTHPLKQVKIKKITPHDIIKIKSFNSILTPQKDILLISQSSGLITHLNFDLGAKVKKGQLLAVIDVSLKKIDLELKEVMKNEAEHQLKYLKNLFEKDKILFRKNIINKDTFNASKNKVILAGFSFKKAKLAYNLAKTSYEKSFIYAPFDGVIVSRNKQKGDIATIGTVLGRIIDDKHLEAIIGVTWEDLSLIQLHRNKKIRIISPDKTKCNADIIGISQNIDPTTKLYPVKLAVNNCNLINNTQVKVKIPLKEYKNAIELERDILELKDENYDLKIENKKLNKKIQKQFEKFYNIKNKQITNLIGTLSPNMIQSKIESDIIEVKAKKKKRKK
jgi:RND family efflux transporter MFP subunit